MPQPRRSPVLSALLGALALVSAMVAVAGPAAAAPNVVTAANLTYAPAELTIRAGDTLTFVNPDRAPHDVVSEASGGDGKPLFRSAVIYVVAGTASAPVNGVDQLAPGSYGYFCSIHNQMRGRLTVEPAPAVPPVPDPALPTVVGSVPTAASIAVHNGALYVASNSQGTVVRLPILPGGLLGQPTDHVTGLGGPLGIVFGPDGTLFVADSHASTRPGRSTDGRVRAIPPGGGAAGTVGQIVVDLLPNGRHNTNGLAVNDGRLYIANGNSTDDGVAGGDPEEPLSGTLLSVKLDARGLTPADVVPPTPDEEPKLIVEATGMRNLFDVAFRPGTSEAWIPTNGLDAQDPFGEDLLHRAYVNGGAPHFGFPECVYKRGADGRPEVGQNTAVTTPCGAHTPPEALLGLHSSADGLAFGPAGGFWDGDLFIARFGNFFGAPNGRDVLRVPIDANGNAGEPVPIFVSSTPLDVTFGPDGLYVADYGGTITLLRPRPV